MEGAAGVSPKAEILVADAVVEEQQTMTPAQDTELVTALSLETAQSVENGELLNSVAVEEQEEDVVSRAEALSERADALSVHAETLSATASGDQSMASGIVETAASMEEVQATEASSPKYSRYFS